MAKAKTKQQTLPHGAGHIETRLLTGGTIRYRARWREPDPIRGTVLRVRTCRTWQEAAAFLEEIAQQKRDDIFEPQSRATLSQAVSEYCDSRLEKEIWTTNTYATNKIFQRKLIDPQLGKIQVTRLRSIDIQHWADRLSKQKSTSTVRSTLSVIRGALRRMMQLGVITINPAIPVEVHDKAQAEKEAWSIEEVHEILAATLGDASMHAFYLVAFSTGMRPGELRALRWEDIDWQGNVISCARTITKDKNGKEIVGTTTKTGKTRHILVRPGIIESLRKWKSVQNERRLAHPAWQDTIVFDRGDGSFMPGTSMISRHNRLFSGLKAPCHSPHSMRHTNATLEDAIGISQGVTRARLGHTSSETTQRYTHAQIAAQEKAAELIARLLLDDPDTTTFAGTESN